MKRTFRRLQISVAVTVTLSAGPFASSCRRDLNLFGQELLAIDDTWINAVNNKNRNVTRASLAKFIKAADAAHSTTTFSVSIRAMWLRVARLVGRESGREAAAEAVRSVGRPNWSAMAAHTRVAVGYDVQIAVVPKHKPIVEQQVANQVVDMGPLTETVAAACISSDSGEPATANTRPGSSSWFRVCPP
jgi:hypothetical protein